MSSAFLITLLNLIVIPITFFTQRYGAKFKKNDICEDGKWEAEEIFPTMLLNLFKKNYVPNNYQIRGVNKNGSINHSSLILFDAAAVNLIQILLFQSFHISSRANKYGLVLSDYIIKSCPQNH